MTTKSLRPVTRETSAFVRDKGLRAVIITVVGDMNVQRLMPVRRSVGCPGR